MTDIPRVGVTPVPNDADIESFLSELCGENNDDLQTILADMKNTIIQTENAGQPCIYAYGKLLNFLASDALSEPKMVRLLAAAIWELM